MGYVISSATPLIDPLALQRALSRDVLVIDATYVPDTERWRVWLALDGARRRPAALEATRDALAVAQRFKPLAGLDLTVIDPDDATVEWRITLDAAELTALRPAEFELASVDALTAAASGVGD